MSKRGGTGGKKKGSGFGCLTLLFIAFMVYSSERSADKSTIALPTAARLNNVASNAAQATAVPTVTTEPTVAQAAQLVSVAQSSAEPAAAEITRLATAYPEEALKAVLGAVEGVSEVTLATVTLGPSVYSEVIVESGAVNVGTADRLRMALVLEDNIEEYVFILTDGRLASAFTHKDGQWTANQIQVTSSGPDNTPVPSPTRAASQTPAPVVNVSHMADTDFWAANGINVRSCPSTSCDVVGKVNQGTRLTATGRVDGEEVNSGNKVWYRVRYGGGEAYVYSSVVTSTAPRPTAQPQVSAPQNPAVSAPVQPAAPSHPAGATARCRDGTYSYSQNRRGTCSHHGGVAQWL